MTRKVSNVLFLSLLTVLRRWTRSLLVVSISAVVGLSGVTLNGLLLRQEKILERTVSESQIQCVVTDLTGKSNQIGVLSVYLDMLTGRRRDQGCYLNEYVREVNALSSSDLLSPSGGQLRRIYSIASDPDLSETSGVTVSFFDGFSETWLTGSETVCLLPAFLLGEAEIENGIPYYSVVTEDEQNFRLQVVGIVDGLNENIVYCPFYANVEGTLSQTWLLDTCTFLIRDNSVLEEAKKALYSFFRMPSLSSQPDSLTAGLLVKDETYLDTLKELEANLALLQLVLPILVILASGISFLLGYLTNRKRRQEFAIMRCMGQTRLRLFMQILIEQSILVLLGCGIGFLGGFIVDGASPGDGNVIVAIAFMEIIGGAICAIQLSGADPIVLMKAEE